MSKFGECRFGIHKSGCGHKDPEVTSGDYHSCGKCPRASKPLGEIANQTSVERSSCGAVAEILMAEGSKEKMDELRIKYMKSEVPTVELALMVLRQYKHEKCQDSESMTKELNCAIEILERASNGTK